MDKTGELIAYVLSYIEKCLPLFFVAMVIVGFVVYKDLLSEIQRCADDFSERLLSRDARIDERATSESVANLSEKVGKCETACNEANKSLSSLGERTATCEAYVKLIWNSVENMRKPTNLVDVPNNRMQTDGIDDRRSINVEEGEDGRIKTKRTN